MGRSAKDDGSSLEVKPLMQKIAKILDDTRTSNATHNRKIKDLDALRSQTHFFHSFTKTLAPLFDFQRRTASSERVLRFIAVFSTSFPSNCDSFLPNFLKFLIVAAGAANRTARLRACQIMSEIILRLPVDADVDDELWDEVIDSMMVRAKDKVPAIRVFAIKALSRFVSDPGNSDILDLFLEALPLEQNAEVRKTLVLALPASNLTSQLVIDYTLDVSESVRKAAYCVLANKFPLQSLSIKLRTLILQRGLADRSDAVVKECLKLLKEEWLSKSCKGDLVELLKYLDVETYEMVGESVMKVLLKAGAVQFNEVDGLQKYIISSCEKAQVGDSPDCTTSVHLIDAEIALYWKTICRHLQDEAQKKGSDAALTTGAEAAVYAAEASDSNDLLEGLLPATISDYVDLVRAHINAGPNYRFSTRQLLLLGTMLDFSDATNRRIASSFVQELLLKPLDHEADGEGNIIVVGDGINLGGDREWASAVSALAKTVHSASGEFEEAVFRVIEELAQPCRERTADFMHWMHCLAVTGLILENVKSLQWVQGKTIAATDLHQLLLLPGAKHVHLDVRRIAVRCLGLFGLLERKLSEELVTQLRQSYVNGPPPISRVACMAIFDLLMWHGPHNIDRATGKDHAAQLLDNESAFQTVDLSDTDGVSEAKVLDLLYAGLGREEWIQSLDCDESESVLTVLVEGFAKLILLSDKYPSISASFRQLLLGKLIYLYFSDQTKDLDRLRQCLSVFFEHYPSLSTNHKESVSRAFIPVMRSMWPGIDGISGGSSVMVSNMRKCAVQASRFMLHMIQAPLYAKETKADDAKESTQECAEESDGSGQASVVWSQEGLAIRIATEVCGFSGKKIAAEKAYVAALCRILVLISFRSSEQSVIKLLRRLMYNVHECASSDKELVKELNRLAERLKSLDRNPDQQLLQETADFILGRLGLEFKVHVDAPAPPVPQTPCPPRSTRSPTRTRRRVRNERSSSDDEDGEASPVSVAPTMVSTRSQRASKTAALSKIANGTRVPIKISEEDEEEEEEETSDVTSEEDSD